MFYRIEERKQIEIIEIILANFNLINKNSTFFSTLCSLLENGISSKAQDLIINLIILKKEEIIKNIRLLRLLEAIIVSFNKDKITFIIEYILFKLTKLITIRQGFFLVRKLCKITKEVGTQIKIVNEINNNIKALTSDINGCLLIQCVIRNFCYKEVLEKETISSISKKVRDNVIEMFETLKGNNIIEQNSKSSNNDLSNTFNLSFISKNKSNTENTTKNTNFISTNISNNKIATVNKSKLNNTKKSINKEKDSIYESYEEKTYIDNNPSLILLFDYIVNKLVTGVLTKNSTKIIECGLKYGGDSFHKKLIDKLLFEDNKMNYSSTNIADISNNKNNIICKWFTYDKGYRLLFFMYDILSKDNLKMLTTFLKLNEKNIPLTHINEYNYFIKKCNYSIYDNEPKKSENDLDKEHYNNFNNNTDYMENEKESYNNFNLIKSILNSKIIINKNCANNFNDTSITNKKESIVKNTKYNKEINNQFKYIENNNINYNLYNSNFNKNSYELSSQETSNLNMNNNNLNNCSKTYNNENTCYSYNPSNLNVNSVNNKNFYNNQPLNIRSIPYNNSVENNFVLNQYNNPIYSNNNFNFNNKYLNNMNINFNEAHNFYNMPYNNNKIKPNLNNINTTYNICNNDLKQVQNYYNNFKINNKRNFNKLDNYHYNLNQNNNNNINSNNVVNQYCFKNYLDKDTLEKNKIICNNNNNNNIINNINKNFNNYKKMKNDFIKNSSKL